MISFQILIGRFYSMLLNSIKKPDYAGVYLPSIVIQICSPDFHSVRRLFTEQTILESPIHLKYFIFNMEPYVVKETKNTFKKFISIYT